MRVAQVSPLFESVPPKLYGGTERVVSYLTEELVGMGHDVTLFASADSCTRARLIAPCQKALRLAGVRDCSPAHTLQLEMVYRRAADFDILHFHTDCAHFPLTRRLNLPNVTTLHGRLDLPSLPSLYQEFMEMPLVSISDDQRRPLPFANWVGTVHHGLPLNLFHLNPRPGNYLAFIGRISPEKRVDLAIQIARAAGLELRIGAKIEQSDREYFEHQVRPLLGLPGIHFLGELTDPQKQEVMGGALATLFPIDWPEPFGLVMIESMACGTPVIAFRRGAVPEVVDHGRTGFIVETTEEAVHAVRAVCNLNRRAVRDTFAARFSTRRMAEDYVRVYEGRLAPNHVDRRQFAGAVHGRTRFD
jgi:glycosyltransferase involved in cell wall biosynthesis